MLKRKMKSLSEKRIDMTLDFNPPYFHYSEEDVKETIKNIKDRLCTLDLTAGEKIQIFRIINEEVGNKLK